jgi:hypothetical protein
MNLYNISLINTLLVYYINFIFPPSVDNNPNLAQLLLPVQLNYLKKAHTKMNIYFNNIKAGFLKLKAEINIWNSPFDI